MFGMTPGETFLVILLIAIVGVGVRRRRVGRVHVDLGFITPIGVQVRAHDLIEAGRFADAVRLIRKESQVPRRTAVAVAQALRAGEVLPDFPMAWDGDLADRVRELLAAGNRKEAVFLTRITEDLGLSEAEAFVDSLAREPR
ncbi:hypothetical protein HII36_07035 [Nonomuraea sp. NN258]|uniref:hypothetical protein n=1 Tax=Nonomuraea antri TaxID=2730852 RepID=UPI0015691199|nr:hypothetical protein [Nonomuraea antri]NRQ31597.1 hypothetical protein [Nonomuraea antri]